MYHDNEDAGDLSAMHAADASEMSALCKVDAALAFILRQEAIAAWRKANDKYVAWEDVRDDLASTGEEEDAEFWPSWVFEEALHIARM